jgi:hypothetical protein
MMRGDGMTGVDKDTADDLLRIGVECYAGHEGEETPRALVLGERRVEVEAVLDRWLAPDHRYFKVRGADGHVYIVRHDAMADRWELTMFQR